VSAKHSGSKKFDSGFCSFKLFQPLSSKLLERRPDSKSIIKLLLEGHGCGVFRLLKAGTDQDKIMDNLSEFENRDIISSLQSLHHPKYIINHRREYGSKTS
jgi:hypothetical protein